MKKDVILFGASKLGQAAYLLFNEKYNILFFCDNNPLKWGEELNGIKIISPSELVKINNDNFLIFITSSFYVEISQQLKALGIENFKIFHFALSREPELVLEEDIGVKDLNLGKFLSETKQEMKIGNLTYMHGGGAGILDCAFLKALMIRFDLKNYLEIGTFMGESLAIVADVAQKAFSISLPDEELTTYFLSRYKKDNFSRYFSRHYNNVTHFYEDSTNFDYNRIKDEINLVFIDGDHTYQGILLDSKKIFEFINVEETFVVWHDFKMKGRYRMPTVNAIRDGVPKKYHGNIFGVDNNMCGVYIPKKYLNHFCFQEERGTLYFYETSINVKVNTTKN